MPGDDEPQYAHAKRHPHEHPDSPVVPVGLGSLADAFIDPETEPERRQHKMTISDYGLVFASVLIAACGQLLLRYGMTRIRLAQPNAHGGELLMDAARSPWVIGGLAVFGISSLLWMITLSKIPLSRAYPFTAIGFLGILAASSIIPPKEHVGPQLWLGAIVVVAGLLIVVQA
jgi:drug/metabolite transporter (DMT)-like permease